MVTEYKPGDRVYRWWETGIGADQQALTIVRVNRLTYTVRTDQGSVFRLPKQGHIVGLVDWDED